MSLCFESAISDAQRYPLKLLSYQKWVRLPYSFSFKKVELEKLEFKKVELEKGRIETDKSRTGRIETDKSKKGRIETDKI